LRTVVVALVVALAGVVAWPAVAEEDFTAMTNADRRAHGLAPLATSADLEAFAQRRAEEMARAGDVWHTRNLGNYIANWMRLGENVGMGPYLSDIQRGFMASSTHRNNILSARFRQIGVGVASDGAHHLYVAVIFREPSVPAAAAPQTAAPAPRRSTRPASPRPATVVAAPAPTSPPPPPAPPPPPLPPAEVVLVPEPEPADVAVARPRPLTESAAFLAGNSWDSALPALTIRQPVLALEPMLPGALLGMLSFSAGFHAAWRRRLRRAAVPDLSLCGAPVMGSADLPIG
jgi:hypothetical protein